MLITELRPAGDVDKDWRAISASMNGVVIAAVYGGRLYTYASGTWTERQPSGATDYNWISVDTDNSVYELIAGIYGGRLWSSANYGVSWTERQPGGAVDLNWKAVACSHNGALSVVCVFGGRVYYSSNYFGSWAELTPAGSVNKNWSCMSCQFSLNYFILGQDTGRLWFTYNQGSSWTEQTPYGSTDKSWKVVSTDGDYLAASEGTRIWYCNGTSNSWSEIRPAGDVDRNWTALAISNSGQTIMAACSSVSAGMGRVYLSNDFGTTWSEIRPLGDVDETWSRLVYNSYDSSMFHLTASSGRIFRLINTPQTNQYAFRFRNDNGNEAAATWKALENVSINLSSSDVTRLRFLIDSTLDNLPIGFQLEYKYKPSGGSYGPWEKV